MKLIKYSSIWHNIYPPIMYQLDYVQTGSEQFELLDTIKETSKKGLEGSFVCRKWKKEEQHNILCLLESRLKGRKPIVVSKQSNTIELTLLGAIDKLKFSLETILGRIQNH
ncbi:hypothetical protein [Mariniflexile sp. HMF6888]|uniref:hypothetical protein n=1 Tax=Mariniflexile sp. HMF6888 TaxID=3373086 RepID=UPI00379E67D6